MVLKKIINNLRFRSKIMWLFGIMFFCSAAISGLFYYKYTSRDIEKSFTVGAEDVLAQLVDTINMRLWVIRQRAEGMLTNNTFVVELSDYLNNPNDINRVRVMGMLSTFLKDLETGESLIHSTYIYTDAGEFDNFVKMRNWEFQFEKSEFCQSYQKEPTASIRWFTVREDEIFQDGEEVIPYVRRFSVSGYKGLQYLIIQIKKNELQQMLTGKYEFFDELIILDSFGNVVIGSEGLDSAELMRLTRDSEHSSGILTNEYRYGEEEYLVLHDSFLENGWQIYGLKSRETLLGSLKNLRNIIAEMMTLVILVGMAAVLFLSHKMTDSLRRLEKRMSCVQKGDLSTRFYYPYRDEVGSLAKSFNYMIDEIQTLVEKQEETIEELKWERDYAEEIQKQKRKAELKALQAQINPHFLYNTLNAITWQAADQGAEEISILSNALGKFFRVSLSKGAEVISLREELEHVDSYLDIQSIRYHSRLTYETKIAEKWLDCRVLKLILQPLAENSIYHGIKEKPCSGMIRIYGDAEEMEGRMILKLTVWDNGLGIASSKLASINAALARGDTDRSEGYGIYNVNERIRLFYGDIYGLSYESEEGQWTKAVVTLPAIEEGESCTEF